MVLRDFPTRKRLARVLMVALTVATSVAVSTPAEARKKQRSQKHSRSVQAPAYNPAFAAIVVDVKTGKTLYDRNADETRHPASITKVMTLYLLFEQIQRGNLTLDSQLRVSAHAASQPPSKLGVRAGGSISVDNAIKALVTRSANDIASAIAENIGGSEQRFARMMTAKARALGMDSTVYVNASGLPDTRQVTTARDLTILARAIQDRFPQYYGYFQTTDFTYAGRHIGNHNRLLGRVEGVDGIKTGYTRMSGFNLMTNARTSSRHVVAIVLGGRSGAIRDRIMASLVTENMSRAYAGTRLTPMVAEVRATTEVAAAPREEEAAPQPAAAPRRIDVANVRPVVASATGSLSTTTPSAFRWVAPRQEREAESRELGRLAYAADTAPSQPRALDARGLTKLAKVQPAATESSVAKSAPASDDDTAGARLAGRSGGWVIQLGAIENEAEAKKLLADARSAASVLNGASPFTEKVVRGSATLWRARFSGFDPSSAQSACKTLKSRGFNCFATKS